MRPEGRPYPPARLPVVEARSPGDPEGAFRVARQKRVDALDLVATGLMNSHRARIVDLAANSPLPIINLKTAQALGLTIPKSLLLRADEVVQ